MGQHGCILPTLNERTPKKVAIGFTLPILPQALLNQGSGLAMATRVDDVSHSGYDAEPR